jgi:hypothetical protein
MANPNPSPKTRFSAKRQPETKGRPTGLRDRISTAFLTGLADDFEKNGIAAIEAVRKNDPSSYLRVVASLQPKEIELKRPLEGVTDDKLAEAIDMLADVIRAQAPVPPEKDEEPKVLQ